MNNKYKIKVETPLIRPGITIETECSEKYVVGVVNKLMELVRLLNRTSEAPVSDTTGSHSSNVADNQNNQENREKL
jgi:hypothetical protein